MGEKQLKSENLGFFVLGFLLAFLARLLINDGMELASCLKFAFLL